jgi:hypothetical protein
MIKFGELFPRVGFIVTNLETAGRAVVRFCNKRGIAEQAGRPKRKFRLEVLKAWTDPAQEDPKTIHHHGYGRFAVDGEMIKLKSRMP